MIYAQELIWAFLDGVAEAPLPLNIDKQSMCMGTGKYVILKDNYELT